MLPSSQSSPKLRRLSPQRSTGAMVHAPPTPAAVGQDQPASTWRQSALQPSPAILLPSSQASSPMTFRSPQTMVEVQGIPGTLHSKKGSDLQAPEQPSPGLTLPSSHCSTPFSLPSLQNSSFTQALPGCGQVQPGSSWQVAEHPSLPRIPPSSH